MKHLVEKKYEYYLHFLRTLLRFNSVFTQPSSVLQAIGYCQNVLRSNLRGYTVFFDDEHNLIALPHTIDKSKDMVYLSAHVDVVDADPDEWTPPYHPWKLYEDEREIVARGVSDCKAGVAVQLYLSELIAEQALLPHNLAFTITFKEEGVGKKTSTQIAKEMGKSLPVGEKSTYLIVLENNVKVKDYPTLCVYAKERGNFVIKVSGTIDELQDIFQRLSKWKPASITPHSGMDFPWTTVEQTGGHMCSVSREDNALSRILLGADPDSIIKAGEETAFSTVPTKIHVANNQGIRIVHSMVLNNRSFDSLAEIHEQLEGIKYSILRDFSISEGFDIEEKFRADKISGLLQDCQRDSEIDLEFMSNVGGSDGSIIYASLDPKIREGFYPIVMGPGSRSQRKAIPPRLTHGKNETFDKQSGKKVVMFLMDVVKQIGCIEER